MIGCNEYIKIGVAQRPVSRAAAIQTGNPYPVVLVGVWNTPDARALESAMHDAFAPYCVRGEWFRLPPDICVALQRTPLLNVSQRFKVLTALSVFCDTTGENPVLEGALICYEPDSPGWDKLIKSFGGTTADAGIYNLWQQPVHRTSRSPIQRRRSLDRKHKSVESMLWRDEGYKVGCRDF
jgi:hypothetical protein